MTVIGICSIKMNGPYGEKVGKKIKKPENIIKEAMIVIAFCRQKGFICDRKPLFIFYHYFSFN